MRRITLALAIVLATALPGLAADRETAVPPSQWSGTWGLDHDASSASLARAGWRFLVMSSLSWPDGRQAVVTLWGSELGNFARCLDYFDAAMRQTGGKCERSGTGL